MKKKKQPRKRSLPSVDDHDKRTKNYHLRVCTWNIRTLNEEGASVKGRKFGVGFVVGERLRHRVLAFTLVDERLATIRIKARFFNISLICAHAPMEEKDDASKDLFYERLERTYERCPRHGVKIVLDEFNVKLGKEG